MKNKTLMIAAAALVAGVVTSEAQVYSANIVGYVNVPVTAATFQLVANPLDNGTNTAADVLTSLPNKSTIQTWNGSGFDTYGKTAGGWTPSNPALPVGTGFFISSASSYTQTFVGNVVPAPGGNTATNSLPAVTFALVGSILPVGGTFADVGTNTFNLQSTLPNKSSVQTWDPVAGFTTYGKTAGGWTPSTPSYTPGQGFFISSASAANWVQTLQ